MVRWERLFYTETRTEGQLGSAPKGHTHSPIQIRRC